MPGFPYHPKRGLDQYSIEDPDYPRSNWWWVRDPQDPCPRSFGKPSPCLDEDHLETESWMRWPVDEDDLVLWP